MLPYKITHLNSGLRLHATLPYWFLQWILRKFTCNLGLRRHATLTYLLLHLVYIIKQKSIDKAGKSR